MTRLLLLLALPVLAHAETPTALPASDGWKPLLDEKLSQWDIWLGSPHISVKGLPDGTPQSKDGHEGTPLATKDPKNVFTTRMENGEPVLAISGEIFGAVTTKEPFSNYHFRAQVKWGERTWEPRLNDTRDSGILYHCVGKDGAMWNAWKRSIEFQVQEGDFGDLFMIAGTRCDVPSTRKEDKRWHYNPAAEIKTFGAGEGTVEGNPVGNGGDFELPRGEWNTIEIYTFGRDAVHIVNGHVVFVIRNIAEADGKPLLAGPLQIQSEGAECLYRRISIRPISGLPAEIRKLARL